VAVVAAKAYELEEVLREVARKASYVALLQNGIGIREVGEKLAGLGKVVRAVVTYGATRAGPFASELRGKGAYYVGAYASGAAEAAKKLAADLAKGGANALFVEDVSKYEWLKLAVNAAINPVTALLRAKNKAVLFEGAWAVAAKAAEEVAAVAQKLGVALSSEEALRALRSAAEATGENVSSMLQDVLAGRPTEVEFINGAVAKLARELGLEASANELLYNLVKAIEELGARGEALLERVRAL